MIDKRQLIFGAMGVAALGVAEALRPRRKLQLLQGATIDQALPTEFGTWSSQTAEGLVSPEQAGRLARTLYSEIVSRSYLDSQSGMTVLLLTAYGDTQSDLLQLHRPESCYPAVGYSLRLTEPAPLRLNANAVLPARRVVATTEATVENILYWTRLGERLPISAGAQRDARLLNAMDGFVADGILVRCSVLGSTPEAFRVLNQFVPSLLQAIRPAQLKAFVGSGLAAHIR